MENGNIFLQGVSFDTLVGAIADELIKRLGTTSATNEQPTAYLTQVEAAKYLRCSKPHVWKLAKEGKIKSTHTGRKVLYDRASIDEHLKK